MTWHVRLQPRCQFHIPAGIACRFVRRYCCYCCNCCCCNCSVCACICGTIKALTSLIARTLCVSVLRHWANIGGWQIFVCGVHRDVWATRSKARPCWRWRVNCTFNWRLLRQFSISWFILFISLFVAAISLIGARKFSVRLFFALINALIVCSGLIALIILCCFYCIVGWLVCVYVCVGWWWLFCKFALLSVGVNHFCTIVLNILWIYYR